MYSLSVIIVASFIAFLVGLLSCFLLSKNEVTLEKRAAIVILGAWLSFTMIAYVQNRELSFFFDAAGMGAVGNLLGIKTSELIKGFFSKK